MALLCSLRNTLSISFLLLSFVYISLAQDASSTRSPVSTADAPSATSSTSPMIGWTIPLVGLEDDPEKPWGANASFGSSDAGYQLFSITIGSNTSANTRGDSSERIAAFPFAVSANPDGSTPDGRRVFMSPGQDNTIPLGPRSALGFTRKSRQGDEDIPTVPFCINLGSKGRWNGSLTLGENFYDRNRILRQLSFDAVPDANHEHNGTFLASGRQRINSVDMARLDWAGVNRNEKDIDPTSGDVILDFNSESITLPHGSWCGQNVSFTFFGVALNVRIPDYLTKSPDRCKGAENQNLSENPLILGKPFFQMANVLVQPNGDMFIATANTWDLPPFPETISEQGFIGFPEDPKPTSSATPRPTFEPSEGGGKNIGAIVGGTIGGVAGLALIGAVAFFLRRRQRANQTPSPYSTKGDIPLN
ncbi:predicted protein [Uncinocarpus reesii 1704]|uniref:Peptidase A1 domain-containing protein n=1 Tax=Uncinocarpus reesii (strain UAMH 1704) TaxID=336963 RepID=C4JVY9_UNCRE|nr:uncharacterized protein UREG_06731 [Uncinocarpus reesii 1704]EEP81866.1 predicted protein [Uncinocarpus reesii 1704]